jgi:hypothetical protein
MAACKRILVLIGHSQSASERKFVKFLIGVKLAQVGEDLPFSAVS